MNVRELVTIWGFQVDDKDLKKVEKNLKDIQDVVKQVGTLAVASGAALFGMAKAVAMTGKELDTSAKRVGLSTQALQEYRFASEQLGLDSKKLDNVFFNLNKTVGEARLGFGAGREAIALLSRETDVLIDFNGSLDSQFNTIVDGLNKVTDESKRAAIAEKFFGGEGRELIKTLEVGSAGLNKFRKEFRALGGVMDGGLINSAKEFERLFSQITVIFKGITQDIAGELLPVFNELVQSFKEYFIQNRNIIRSNLKATLEALITLFKSSYITIREVVTFVTRLVGGYENLVKIGKMVIAGFIAFKALQLASTFGNLVIGIVDAVKGMKALGTVATLTNLKIMAIPIAITALIAGIGLLVEDIISFANGRDSVVGRAISWIDEFGGSLSGWKKVLFDIGKVIVTVLLTPLRAVVNTVKVLSTAFKAFKGEASIGDVFSGIGSGIANTLGFGVDSGASMFGLEGVAPSAPMPSNAGTTNNSTKNVNGNFNINVQGLDERSAQNIAKQSFDEIFKGVAREADRDIEPPFAR